MFGAFFLGLGVRRWLQRHIALLVLVQMAAGIGALAVLAGWSFDLTVGNLYALGVLLVAQLTALAVASRVFRSSTDHEMIAFWMFGE